ncbi:hypothetical protein GQ43DRAFT_439294 [Delitschia confertaspora ATCC 74209]|uniref:Uncharacterized protein n=1 Tax=Delitschia confertaspora ATCC 74209 TaxID=1513339 RepID=A0A9P4JR99_9PLEO|nr:hypothetical protein GQ43DRAFT_439294 [Delitschia confertaspora ATCC 74209]
MADVRSLLRQERAARQQSSRPAKASAAPVPSGKKRKASDDTVEERKRNKTEEAKGLPASFFDRGADTVAQDADTPPAPLNDFTRPGGTQEQKNEAVTSAFTVPAVPNPTKPTPTGQDGPTETELAEMAAFERELLEMDTKPTVSAFAAGAVIEAAPMTAAELAAQAREDLSAQRDKAQVENEAEKEDAARMLEEEFDEMEGLEERARKLRERREALRVTSVQSKAQGVIPSEPVTHEEEDKSESDEDDDDDDDDWDGWRFRTT